jgi:hypothetical protein
LTTVEVGRPECDFLRMTTDDYRRKALEMRERAGKALDAETRDLLRLIAADWEMLAGDSEKLSRLEAKEPQSGR